MNEHHPTTHIVRGGRAATAALLFLAALANASQLGPSCVGVGGTWRARFGSPSPPTSLSAAEFTFASNCTFSITSLPDAARLLRHTRVLFLGDSTARYLTDHIAQWVQPGHPPVMRKGDPEGFRIALLDDAIPGFALGMADMRDLGDALGGAGAPEAIKRTALLGKEPANRGDALTNLTGANSSALSDGDGGDPAWDAVVINAMFWPLRAWHTSWGPSGRRYATCDRIEHAYRTEARALAAALRANSSAFARSRIWLRTSTGIEDKTGIPGTVDNACYRQSFINRLNGVAVEELGGVVRVLDVAKYSTHDGSLGWGRVGELVKAPCCHFTGE